MRGELRLEKLSKSFGGKAILADFTLTLPARGTVALLGPSGCGKTTLLRLIAGLEQPEGGRVILPPGAKLSMVFQEDRLIDVLDARGNILAVLPAGQPQVADFCLERCGLSEFAGLYPHEMSGGMKRRLALARAVAYGGDLLLLDEPLKGLDPDTKAQVTEFLFRREDMPGLPGSQGALHVFVTHDAHEAKSLADSIIRLDGPPLIVRNIQE